MRMMIRRGNRNRELTLTVLIDLLVQILFVIALFTILGSVNNKENTGYDFVEVWKNLVSGESIRGKTKTEQVKALKERFDEQKMRIEEQEKKIALQRKEIDDLRTKLSFFAAKNEHNGKGGQDYRACWRDDKTQRPHYLFSITIVDTGLIINKAWPKERDGEINKIPGVNELLSEKPISLPQFTDRVQPVYKWSRNQAPECRHYVKICSKVDDRAKSDKSRLLIERYFYKTEILEN
jgi:hypothetical protein